MTEHFAMINLLLKPSLMNDFEDTEILFQRVQANLFDPDRHLEDP